MNLTLETLKARIAEELSHGSIDVREFVGSYYPNDVEAGQILMRLFDARLLCGRLRMNLVEFDGQISGIADDTRSVWH